MANGILSYTSKDYDSIKEDLLSAISSITDTWTSREDSDPGIVLLKLVAAVGDMLCYNFDRQALEYYGPTVTQRKNAQKLFELVGYKMHWYRCAKTQVSVSSTQVLPEYMTYCKRIIDGEDPIEVYRDYRIRYDQDVNLAPSPRPAHLSMPAVLNAQEIEPQPGTTRWTWQVQGEPDPAALTPQQYGSLALVRNNAAIFAGACREQYTAYSQRNPNVEIHTFINDPAKTLNIYSSVSSSIPYSLIPTTEEPSTDPSGNYRPTITIAPGETKTLQAIQGKLCSVQFTSNQLRNNCFYVPDTRLDEDYMYLSYKTTDTTTASEQTVFIKKVDNLLTYITPDDEQVDILFQFAIDDYDCPYIELSSYWRSKLGEGTVTFTFYYFKTMGSTGNITTGYLNRINGLNMRTVSVTNSSNANSVVDEEGNLICEPGKNPQTARDAYIDSLNYIQTYNTLVTIYDFARYTRRQSGISNALAVDIQYADDLNSDIRKLCNSYTKEQLLSILGTRPELALLDQPTLANILYKIRKVNYTYKNDIVLVSDAVHDNPVDDFICYTLNIYPIWEDYTTSLVMSDESIDQVAYYISNYDDNGNTVYLPYKLYGILTDTGSTNNIARYLTKKYRLCKIANIEPGYRPCRVFEWRCCGTLHLTKSVSKEDADTIVRNVIINLQKTFGPRNVEFGKRITDMEVIETVLNSDSRIRYFDGGLGNIKLIDFANIQPDTGAYFNVKAYFNPESIMRYVQTEEDNSSGASEYQNYITVDPSYIQGGVVE